MAGIDLSNNSDRSFEGMRIVRGGEVPLVSCSSEADLNERLNQAFELARVLNRTVEIRGDNGELVSLEPPVDHGPQTIYPYGSFYDE